MLSSACSLVGLLVLAAAIALLLTPAAGLAVLGLELLWVGWALDPAPRPVRARRRADG